MIDINTATVAELQLELLLRAQGARQIAINNAEITLLRTQTITAEALAGRISDPARAYADTLEARREVVGLVGAQLWVGAATTATCKPCKAPMKPLLQLEAHAGGGLGLGGGGRGYAQLCSACGAAAWFVQRVK